MTKYGQAFYGSDEIHGILDGQVGTWKLAGSQIWLNAGAISFKNPTSLYKLCKSHWFYTTDEFKRAKKPINEIVKPLADYSDDELQSEIGRRKAQDDEITILARNVCADTTNDGILKIDFIKGKRDDTLIIRVAKAAIIAGMKL